MATITELRQACKQAGISYSGKDRKADLEAKLAGVEAPPAAEPVVEPEAPKAVNRVERIKLAKDEVRAAREAGWTFRKGEWHAAEGVTGDKPPTPNHDAINRHEPVAPIIPPAEGTLTRARSANARYQASQERSRSGEKRGKGTKLTEEELEAWITAERKADPTLTRNQAEQISYWLDGNSVGIDRFNRAWDRLVAAEQAAKGGKKSA